MEKGNQMQKRPTASLYMKMEAFDQLLFFIKIIGSDTLWFQLPPSEVLFVAFLLVEAIHDRKWI